MRILLALSLSLISFTGYAQHDPMTVGPLNEVVMSLATPKQQAALKGLKTKAGEDCEKSAEETKKAPYIEIPNAILHQVSATGGIESIPGSTVSKARGIVTVVQEPGTIEQVRNLQAGKNQSLQDLNYSVIDPAEATQSNFRFRGDKVRYQENFSVGKTDVRFRAEVGVKGKAMLSLRISPSH